MIKNYTFSDIIEIKYYPYSMEKNQITTANHQLHTETKSEFPQWTKELEQLARVGVREEIAQHKAAGRPIFYSKQGVPIVELADGRCFEYRHLKDGTREIIREVPQQ
jgi:hypothetical protein